MRFDTLAGWLAWQETVHPVEMDLGLARTRLVHEALGYGAPPPFPIVTVAGTNGKGSTVAFVQSLLTASGARTGSYTSPHLVHYNERIRIDGEPVEDSAIMAAFDRIDRARGGITLTYFEFGTLAAIDVFRSAAVDAAVLEVGIGGRLDAVNLFDADVAVVTPIDIDHVRWLGSDRESIGREKAGVFRPGRPAVIADRAPPTSLEAAAEGIGAPLSSPRARLRCRARGIRVDLARVRPAARRAAASSSRWALSTRQRGLRRHGARRHRASPGAGRRAPRDCGDADRRALSGHRG